jgi:hypothetical protein
MPAAMLSGSSIMLPERKPSSFHNGTATPRRAPVSRSRKLTAIVVFGYEPSSRTPHNSLAAGSRVQRSPCCDPEVRHGGRCHPAMFTKQVSRRVDSLDPRSWPRRRSGSSKLEEKTWSRARSEVFVPTPYGGRGPRGQARSGASTTSRPAAPATGRPTRVRASVPPTPGR